MLLLKLVPSGTDSSDAVTLLRCRWTWLILVHRRLGHAHKDAGPGLLLRIDSVAEPGRGVILPHVHAPLRTSGQLADVVHGLIAPCVRQFGALSCQFALREVASLGGHNHVRRSNLLLARKAAIMVDHRILLLLLLLLLKLLRLLLMVRVHWGKTGLVELLLLHLLLLLLLLLLGTHHVDADKVGPSGLGWRSGVGPPHRTRHG